MNAQDTYLQAFNDGLRPDPELTVTEWADTFRVLPRKSSSEPGKYRSQRTPYVREIGDCLSPIDPVQEICVMKCTQVGLTELANNFLGYVVDMNPGPFMFVLPTVELAKDHSKQKLAPTIEETPRLKGKIKESRSRDSGNTIQTKEFPGGILFLSGSNSPASLRAKSIRFLVLDDIDGYPPDVGGEGDPVDLAKKRTDSFSSRKKILEISTPTEKGNSRIEKSFEESDQRFYHVPCPFCGEMQPLEWGGRDAKHGIKFKRDDQGFLIETWYQCRSCHEGIDEYHKTKMLELGQWIPTYPDRRKRGYHLSALYSPIGWVSWKQTVQEFLDAQKDKEALKVWTNTRLALTFEEYHPERDFETLKTLLDGRPKGLVPSEGVLAMTAGVDVQDDGFWYVIRAWGANLESWLIREGFVETWEALELVLWGSNYQDILENQYIVNLTFIDSAGHRTAEVYDFCRAYKFSRPIRGIQRMAAPWKITKIDTYPNGKAIPGGVSLINVNTTYFKDLLSSKLQISPADPGAFHLHSEVSGDYLGQMCAEYRDDKGVWQVHSSRPNHLWDCEIYALCAADFMQLKFWAVRPESGAQAIDRKKPKSKRRRW